ncbi:signal transduction histidine kinase [Actinoplanes lutulentus]|uniref:histidine kinase n=1 Tax=Actinoplanes lutulentus TaxID=1287878 RepID=A0A327ZK05_9ACTN|nr:sensor histidine kinase [Actinoplanes lutulentus]MBB2940662.1 signal transduction histidine kinase [Actinoplanes lutulentus]RAK42973.1 signal transduction histidine kinase [Actinoplanes lutulentus]
MERVLWILSVGAYAVLVLEAVAGANPWPAIASGAAFTALLIAGSWLLPGRAWGWWAGYVLVQIGLGLVMFGAAHAAWGGTLLLIVLVVQAAQLLPLRVAVVVTLVVPFGHVGMDLGEGLREGAGMLVAALMALVVTRLLRRERQTRLALVLANEQLAQLATTQERNRVARDIHDGLGHYLTTVQMQIRAGRALLGRDPQRADAVLAQAEDQAKEALSEVRRSVSALRAPRLPLQDRVERLARETSQSGLPTTSEARGTSRALPPEVEETLYRAAQEGLTNVRRHAHASQAHVLLEYDPAEVRVVVGDDGCGDAPGPSGGFGLTGLHERVAGLGGTVLLDSVPGKGSTLTVTAPA